MNSRKRPWSKPHGPELIAGDDAGYGLDVHRDVHLEAARLLRRRVAGRRQQQGDRQRTRGAGHGSLHGVLRPGFARPAAAGAACGRPGEAFTTRAASVERDVVTPAGSPKHRAQ